MSKATPTELIQAAQSYAENHECPYASDVLASPEIGDFATLRLGQLGNTGVLLTKIDEIYLDLKNFHSNDTCRPTKVDGRATSESRLWDAQLHHTKSLISHMGLRAASAIAA